MEDVDATMDTDIEMMPAEEKEMYIEDLPEDYQDPHKNWQRLLDTMRDLNEWTVFPKDWVKQQKRHIRIYSLVIPQMKMSKQMEDRKFQEIVMRMEENLRMLEEGLKNKQLILDAYGYFVENLIEAMTMYHEMNELCNLMEGL